MTPEAVKGLYVPRYEVGEKLKSLLKIADETEINALVVDAKDAGVTTYQSEVPLAKEIGATTDYISDPKALVDELIFPRDLLARLLRPCSTNAEALLLSDTMTQHFEYLSNYDTFDSRRERHEAWYRSRWSRKLGLRAYGTERGGRDHGRFSAY